jgi:hypothetical protein
MTIQDKAREAYQSMETATRGDGTGRLGTYIRVKDDAPEWVRELAHTAHGDMMPDDWRYDAIHSALSHIADSDDPEDDAAEFADSTDIYNSDLIAWVGTGGRSSYVDEAAEEFGPVDDFYNSLQRGQYMELSEIYGLVLRALEEVEADDEED